jgi:hypothetical protein
VKAIWDQILYVPRAMTHMVDLEKHVLRLEVEEPQLVAYERTR